MSISKKSENIETLRGIACVLLVLYHVIGPLGGGLKIEIGSPYRILADSMTYIRMPLFTFISGYIYSIYKVRNNDYVHFVKGKFRRLLVPLFFVGIPFSLLQSLAPGVNQDVTLWDAFFSFIIPINHFWFIQAIFIIFITIGFFEQRGLISSKSSLYALLLGSSILFLILNFSLDLFGVNGAIYLLPFFVAGMICQNEKDHLSSSVSKPALFLLFLIFASLLYLACTSRELVVDRTSISGLLIGCISCAAFFFANLRSKRMVWLGSYSYAIFLYHPVFTVLSRYTLKKLGISTDSIYIGSGLILGLVGPVIFSNIIRKYPPLPVFFLGESKQHKPKISTYVQEHARTSMDSNNEKPFSEK